MQIKVPKNVQAILIQLRATFAKLSQGQSVTFVPQLRICVTMRTVWPHCKIHEFTTYPGPYLPFHSIL